MTNRASKGLLMSERSASAADALAELTVVADDPDAYVARWKQATGRKALGAFPMNCPAEIVHAGGALPVLLQENREPDSLGRNLLAEFYCGYTRNIADQAAKGMLNGYDGFFLADHCTQLLGAVDVVRSEVPDTPVYFGQLPTSLTDKWTPEKACSMMQSFIEEMSRLVGSRSLTRRWLGRSRSSTRTALFCARSSQLGEPATQR
nr:2-hydroxyacyl-CoA dehydratase family protein [Pseudonocardia sp. KRD291]